MVAKSYPFSNSDSLVSLRVTNRYLCAMDARSIRVANLQRLVDEERARGGTLDTLAARAQSSGKTLSQIVNGTLLPSGNPRGVGHALARQLEHAAGKPPGWLDTLHNDALPSEARALIEEIMSAAADGRLRTEQMRALYDVVVSMESS